MTKPEFIIAGAMKGGTTAIRVNFSRHPEVFMSNIFSKERISKELSDNYVYDDFDDVTISKNGEMDFFNVDKNYYCGLNSYFKFFKKWDNQKVVAECSANYLYLDEWPNTHYRIKGAMPDVNLIFSIRDPISRSFSHWNHIQQERPYWGRHYIDKTFYDCVAESWCPIITRSKYIENLKKYLKLFDREKMLILIQEQIVKNVPKEYNKICNFMNIGKFSKDHQYAMAHRRTYEEKIDDKSKEYLLKLFSDSVKELQDLFPELDYSGWCNYS